MSRLVMVGTIVCLMVCALVLPASADLGVGARALGMGGAFTAIANDSSAVYYNPAGLSQIAGFNFQPPNVQVRVDSNLNWRDVISNPPTSDEGRLDLLKKMSSGVTTAELSLNTLVAVRNFAVFAIPTARIDLDARGLSFDDGLTLGGKGLPDIGSTASMSASAYVNIGASVARKLGKGNIGVTVKSITGRSISEQFLYASTLTDEPVSTTVYDEQKQGMAMDVGYLVDVRPNTSVGVMARNLIRPALGSFTPDTMFNVGVAHKLAGGKGVVAADIESIFNHGRLNLGAEFAPAKMLKLWAGIYHGDPTLGAGLSILGMNAQLSYSPKNSSLIAGSIFF